MEDIKNIEKLYTVEDISKELNISKAIIFKKLHEIVESFDKGIFLGEVNIINSLVNNIKGFSFKRNEKRYKEKSKAEFNENEFLIIKNNLINKKCKYCGTIEDLQGQYINGKQIYYNVCKKCFSKKISNLEKGQKHIYNQVLKFYLFKDHIENNLSVYEISKKINLDVRKVKEALKGCGIEEIHICKHCGTRDNLRVEIHNYKEIIIDICKKCFSKDRSEKWAIRKKDKNKMDQFFERRARTWQIKYGTTTVHGVSKISQELFWNIYENLPEKLQEKTYFADLGGEFITRVDSGTNYSYDFVISNIKFCIEFNGDYWHKSPEVIDFNNLTDLEWNNIYYNIWLPQDKKIRFLNEQGFTVDTIWESEYRSNKSFWIKNCLQGIFEISRQKGGEENVY